MREEQAVVAEFVRAHGLETDGWVRFLDLGDCMFSLLCLCGVLELDAKDALDGALAKYERRIAQYGEAGQRDAAPESR